MKLIQCKAHFDSGVCDRQTDRLTNILTTNAERHYVVRPNTNAVSYYGIMLTCHSNLLLVTLIKQLPITEIENIGLIAVN